MRSNVGRNFIIAVLLLAIAPIGRIGAADDDPGSNIFDMKKPGSKRTTPPDKPGDATQKAPAADAPTATSAATPTATTQPVALAPSRLAVPSTDQQTAAMKMVRGLYAKELQAAGKQPDKLLDLAAKMFQAGREEQNDPAAKFALLSLSKESATSASNFALAIKAATETGKTFDVDTLKLKAGVALAIGRAPLLVSDRALFALQVIGLSEELVAGERFDLVSQLDDLAHRVAISSEDAALLQSARVSAAEHAAAKSAYAAAVDARAVLKANLSDGPANTTFGRYCCFVQDDWEHGLPWLAAGNDAKLRAAAAGEIANPASADDKFATAEAWWAIAAAEAPAARRHIQSHAASFYAAATQGLAGVAKLKLDKRLKELASADDLSPGRAVDLLSNIDVDRDLVAGTWTRLAIGSLVSSADDRARIEFPYHPPLDYDYRVTFTRDSGNDGLDCVCVGGEGHRQFCFSLGGSANTVAGFSEIMAQPVGNNPTGVRGHWLDNGHRHTLVVHVRPDRVSATLDDKPIGGEMRTDFRDLGLYGKNSLKRSDTLGLQAVSSSYTIHEAYAVELKGHGQNVTAGDPDQSALVATVSYQGRSNGHKPFTLTLYANGTVHSSLDAEALWFVHGNTIVMRWGDIIDSFQLANDRRSFTSKTKGNDSIKGEVTDGAL